MSKKLAVAAGAFIGMVFSIAEAKAEYVCTVRYYPSTTTGYGNEGYILLTTYSAPNCSGTFDATSYVCSPGATSTSCVSSTAYRYDRQSILAVYQSLQRAAAADQGVDVNAVTCNGGSGSCFSSVGFTSD
jgi:hypothetical protein